MIVKSQDTVYSRIPLMLPLTSQDTGYLVSKSSAYYKWEQGLQEAGTLTVKLTADSVTKDGEKTKSNKAQKPELTKNRNLG